MAKDTTYQRYLKDPNHPRCSIEDCTNISWARGWCPKHYGRWRKYGNPYEIHRRLKGTGHITTAGYKILWRPWHPNAMRSNGHIGEHTLVMSGVLERPLVKGEQVHHLNGDRLDNRPENLELWSTQQPPGQRVEDKVRWALELLTLYSDQPQFWPEDHPLRFQRSLLGSPEPS